MERRGERLDLTISPSPSEGLYSSRQSLEDINSQVLAFVGTTQGLGGEVDSTFIPNKWFEYLHKEISQLKEHYQSLKTILDNFGSNRVQAIHNNFDKTTIEDENGHEVSVHDLFEPIRISISNALSYYHNLANVLGCVGSIDLSKIFKGLSKELSKANETQEKLSQVLQEASKSQSDIKSLHEDEESMRNELEQLKKDGERGRKTINEYSAESTEKLASIREVKRQAEQLNASIENYQPSFDVFQRDLEDRNKTFIEGSDNQRILFEQLNEMKNKIEDLTEQAENMLTGSTVAGLSSSFSKLEGELEKKRFLAELFFYASIFLMALSLWPLVQYALNFSGSGKLNSLELSQVINRGLLILPSLLLAKFTSNRHRTLFRLKENYAHKYSVASSVDGFKKQAEPFKDAIAAATFFELTFNPANQMEQKMNPNNNKKRRMTQVMKWLMQKLKVKYDGDNSST